VVTQKQIAEHLGVSRQLVGFALNGGGTIAEKTRQEIIAAAAELGYHRNEIARAMVTGRNPVLGFLAEIPGIETVGRLLTGALDGAAEGGYTIKLLSPAYPRGDEELVRRCVEMRLAGVLVVHVLGKRLDFLTRELGRRGIPVAVMDDCTPRHEGIHVVSDDAQGCHAAIAHLHALGHRRIAFVSANPGPSVVASREEGFRRAMAEFGLTIPEDFVVRGDWGRCPMTADATHALLDHPDGPPTAVCCIDDKSALTVARTVRKRGMSVPRDISVIGYADLTLAEFGDPPLTTVAQPFAEMGRAAARLLLERIAMGETSGAAADTAALAVLPTEIIVRESTAPPPPHPVRPAPR
jgi:DNA-binding LacI/PurR family transcriptional regulator